MRIALRGEYGILNKEKLRGRSGRVEGMGKMKKGLIILLCVLVVAGAAVGFGWYRLHSAVSEAQALQQTIYEQYQTMLANTEKTALAVTENGTAVGTYTLKDLGVLEATQQAVTACFTSDERMTPELFAEKDAADQLSWRTQEHAPSGSVRVDMVRYTDEAVWEDLQALPRHAAQDAYAMFDGEKFCVVAEVPGNVLNEEPVREALRTAAAGITVTSGEAETMSFDLAGVADCYAQPEITVENTTFDFDALLQEKIKELSYPIDLNLEGQKEASKVVTLSGDALSALVSVDDGGYVQVDGDKLAVLVAGWKALADTQNTSFILNTYVDGPKPMDFLKVDYQLDTENLTQAIEAPLKALEPAEIRAQMLLYKNGEPYEPLTDVYVEVDIDNQKLTVYKSGEVVISTDVVTGNLNGFQTITGLYYAYNKERDQWMSGEDYLVFSEYWIGIDGAYGLHDASWRTHFGKDFYVNGGSHGCVNIPVEAMPTIFETVEVGDAIILFGKNKWFEPDPETTRILQS